MPPIDSAPKNTGRPAGRPQAGWLRLRLDEALLGALAQWIATQPDPKPRTAAAALELIRIGLEASGLPAPARPKPSTLDERIGRIEKRLAHPQPGGPPTPEKGMQLLRRGLTENKLRRLKLRKKRSDPGATGKTK